MKIVITFFISFFSFSVFSEDTIYYACNEWQLEQPEYKSFLSPEKMGKPFIAEKYKNNFIIKDRLENKITLNYLGRFNNIIDIYTTYDEEYYSHTIYFIGIDTHGKSDLIIKEIAYNSKTTYITSCGL